MKHVTKRVLSSMMVFVLFISAAISLPVSAVSASGEVDIVPDENIQEKKISDELLEKLQVSYDDFLAGDYEISDNKIPCIIWIDDIDMEIPVRAGIDAAERTEPVTIAEEEGQWEYPYEVFDLNGYKVVEVELDDSASDVYVQTYMETERATAASLYSEKNSRFVAENFEAEDVSVKYISEYTPCIFADLSIEKIKELNQRDDVHRIGYFDDSEGENSAINPFNAGELANLNQHMKITCVDQAWSNYGVSGAGVKVGQIETAVPNGVYVVNGPSSVDANQLNHANNVCTIMRKVAPNATYYATSSTFRDVFCNNLEALIKQGVNVINCSYGWDESLNVYDELSRWVDHITYNHDVHFVIAAGNEGNPGVVSPGMAYNVITVGNTNMTSPYNLHINSSYNINGAVKSRNLTFKPDIVAPGTYSSGRYGTSYSAPIVTGTIALMCQYQPALKTKQHIVKAILAASTSKSKRYVTSSSDFKKYGAGMLDARAALWVISKGNYSTATGALSGVSESRTYNMTVTPSDTTMRVALAYANRIEFSSSGHSLGGTPNGTIGELKLEVFAPNGTLVSANTTSGANLKIVQFTPTVTGTYRIKVTLTSKSSQGTTNFGVAWR